MGYVEESVQRCESLISYTFKNKLLACEALQTSGYHVSWHGTHTPVPKNTRLAVFGDTALNTALCRLWYPKALDKGAWTEIRNVATNKNLAEIGVAHGLDKCVILNPGTTEVSIITMATTVEAILGAVELDGGPDALMQVIRHLGLIHPLIT